MRNNNVDTHVDKQPVLGDKLATTCVPMQVFSTTLMSSIQTATLNGREDEREELVCRLLASTMSVEEISIVLNLRKRDVEIIQKNHASIKIPDYTKKLKQRRERRPKTCNQ